jgi:hypothetical protein
MSKAEWQYAYAEIWKRYYSYEHCKTVLQRAGAKRDSFASSLFALFWFKGCSEIEDIHPVEGGFLRRKVRRNRRSTLPMEPAWSFYPKYFAETFVKFLRWSWMYARMRSIYLSIKRDPKRREYTDLALTPVTDDEFATHEMFHTEEAASYVEQQRKIDQAVKSGAYAPGKAKQPEPLVAAK